MRQPPRKWSLYLAGPLFSEAELRYNEELAAHLESYFDVYLPQRDGGKMVDLIAQGVAPADAALSIYERDILALREADVLLILMDGRSIDEGAAFELGYAKALGKVCVGLQTDPRRLLPHGNNPMIQVPLQAVFSTVRSVVQWAREFTSNLLPSSTS